MQFLFISLSGWQSLHLYSTHTWWWSNWLWKQFRKMEPSSKCRKNTFVCS